MARPAGVERALRRRFRTQYEGIYTTTLALAADMGAGAAE